MRKIDMYNINRLKDMLVVMEDCILKLENFNNVYNTMENVETMLRMDMNIQTFKLYMNSTKYIKVNLTM